MSTAMNEEQMRKVAQATFDEFVAPIARQMGAIKGALEAVGNSIARVDAMPDAQESLRQRVDGMRVVHDLVAAALDGGEDGLMELVTSTVREGRL